MLSLSQFSSVVKERLKNINCGGGEDDPDGDHHVEEAEGADVLQLDAEHDLSGLLENHQEDVPQLAENTALESNEYLG